MAHNCIPAEAAVAVLDMLDHCARIKPGQNVLILAAVDGLCGGRNIVDEKAVAWVQSGVQQRGAHAAVMWVDMPMRPNVIWPDMPSAENIWRVPPIVRHAVKGADIVISHILDLSSEEETKEWNEILAENKVPFVRNMATTAPLLCSAWARTPHELISEIRYRTAEMIKPGDRWRLTHPNGTHLEGLAGDPIRPGGGYAYWRHDGRYLPFPEGIYPAVNPLDTNGIFVCDRMMPVWARHIGIPPKFTEPVRITVEATRMIKFEGGPEAATIEAFLRELAKVVGDEYAFEIRGPHGGIHPCAAVSEVQCPDADYREFIASFHTGAVHMHLGRAGKSFPFNLHTAAEARGATLVVGGNVLHDNGRLAAMDHPGVKAVAARYPGRPGLDGARWLWG